MLYKLTFLATAGVAVAVDTASVHPLQAVALGALCAALGWSAYGTWLMSTGEIRLRQFFLTMGLAMFTGVVAVTFLPISNFTKLLVVCAIAGTASEEILKRVRAGVINMFGKSSNFTDNRNDKSSIYDNDIPKE